MSARRSGNECRIMAGAAALEISGGSATCSAKTANTAAPVTCFPSMPRKATAASPCDVRWGQAEHESAQHVQKLGDTRHAAVADLVPTALPQDAVLVKEHNPVHYLLGEGDCPAPSFGERAGNSETPCRSSCAERAHPPRHSWDGCPPRSAAPRRSGARRRCPAAPAD